MVLIRRETTAWELYLVILYFHNQNFLILLVILISVCYFMYIFVDLKILEKTEKHQENEGNDEEFN
jgi:hypothetical protein